MENIPDWVPRGVVAHFLRLDQQKENLHNSRVEQEDLDALRRCILSTGLEKAWESINRRSDKCDPKEIAKIIVRTSWLSRRIQYYPTTSEIAGYRKLSKKVRALSSEFDDAVEPLVMGRLDQWLGDGPQYYLEDLAVRLDDAADHYTDVRQHVKELSGKPKSKSGTQTYVIRFLFQNTRRLYGQPLHDVVAAIAGEILGEPVDPETARSIYRNPRD